MFPLYDFSIDGPLGAAPEPTRPSPATPGECVQHQARANRRTSGGEARAVCGWCASPEGTSRWRYLVADDAGGCPCPNIMVHGDRPPTPDEFDYAARRCPDHAYGFVSVGSDEYAVPEPPTSPPKLQWTQKLPDVSWRAPGVTRFVPPSVPGPGVDPRVPGPGPGPGLDPRVPGPGPGPGLDPRVPGPGPGGGGGFVEPRSVWRKYWYLWLALAGAGGYYVYTNVYKKAGR